jgi:hypothetical protein
MALVHVSYVLRVNMHLLMVQQRVYRVPILPIRIPERPHVIAVEEVNIRMEQDVYHAHHQHIQHQVYHVNYVQVVIIHQHMVILYV